MSSVTHRTVFRLSALSLALASTFTWAQEAAPAAAAPEGAASAPQSAATLPLAQAQESQPAQGGGETVPNAQQKVQHAGKR